LTAEPVFGNFYREPPFTVRQDHDAQSLDCFRDIEHRDQALRDAQQQLHLITDSMSALVTRCTPDLKYSWVSKPYADWLQKTRNEIIGAPIEEIIGKEAFNVLRPYYEQTLKGETVRLELEVEFQSIGNRWVRFWSLSPVGDRLKTKIFHASRASIITS